MQQIGPLIIAAVTGATGAASAAASTPPSTFWWSPMFGPAITIASGLVAYIVSHTMLKSRQEAFEQRLDRLEPKLDSIADRLARMEGALGVK
jgi:hypothetical protein